MVNRHPLSAALDSATSTIDLFHDPAQAVSPGWQRLGWAAKINIEKLACFSAAKNDRQRTTFTTHSTTN
jgi:hypothetical protein